MTSPTDPINTIYLETQNRSTNECTKLVDWTDGLTKREYFAAMAMQGLLSNNRDFLTSTANDAVLMADLLIASLNKNKPTPTQ
jgi:hypothetical protein